MLQNIYTSGKKGMLSYGKCLFERIGANLAHIQSENPLNVPKKKCMFGSQWVKFNMNKVSGTESNTWINPTSERSGIVTIL